MQPEHGQYNFIMNPQQNKPAGNFKLGQGKNKIIAVVVFMLFFVVVVIVGISFISSIGKVNNEDLVSVRAQQTELTRVLELGKKDVTDSAVKNKLANLEAVVTSDGSQLGSLLNDRKVEVTKLQLAAAKDTDSEEKLKTAKQDGSYDTVLIEIVDGVSNDYYKSLKAALAEATTNKEKGILETALSNVEAVASQQ